MKDIDIATYSLNTDQINSDNYYKDIAGFAEEVILNGRSIIDSKIIDLKNLKRKYRDLIF